MLTMDDINRMAHGAGLSSSDLRVKQLAKAAYDLGMQHEREACVQIADRHSTCINDTPNVIATTIRARSKQ